MRVLVEHLMPGRWDEARQPTAGEIAGTLILELPLTEASAKVRTGGPIDAEDDYAAADLGRRGAANADTRAAAAR